MVTTFDSYLEEKARLRRERFLAHFTGFERTVLFAWCSRMCVGEKKYHYAKAVEIRNRYDNIISRAIALLEE